MMIRSKHSFDPKSWTQIQKKPHNMFHSDKIKILIFYVNLKTTWEPILVLGNFIIWLFQMVWLCFNRTVVMQNIFRFSIKSHKHGYRYYVGHKVNRTSVNYTWRNLHNIMSYLYSYRDLHTSFYAHVEMCAINLV